MPKKKTFMTILAIASAAAAVAWAQPPDFAVFPGDERAREGRGHEARLEKMTEYLELSDSQVAEWQAITEQHTEAMRARWEQVGVLRQEFGALADQDDPDLTQLGQLALDLHREMKTARSSRADHIQKLEEVLTPDQATKFEALKAARELAGDRSHRGPRGGRNRPDRD